ncbi:MAG: methyltransferase, partial [Nitrosopumilaceae archaeon]|nr:methyltransferase [Nitrosopumilaceae archaeon]NIX62880.1 methyltransferase [Nitrosopumilaceae archaeon]
YFSVTALLRLCKIVKLSIIRIERKPVHGGSLRIYAGKQETYPNHAERVLKMAETEKNSGLTGVERFVRFAKDVQNFRHEIIDLLTSLKNSGKHIAGYGAPAKGNTLLNYCGIDTRFLDFTVDKNPLKVGKYTPGMHLPVLPVSTLLEKQPDYVLILAWNFAEEILQQQQPYRDLGGKFIIPIPTPMVV